MKYEPPDSNYGCSHTRRRWVSGATSSKNTDPRERAVARWPRPRGEQTDGVLSSRRWCQQEAEERWHGRRLLEGGVLAVWRAGRFEG